MNMTGRIQIEKVFPSGLKLASGLSYLDQGHTFRTVDTLERSTTVISAVDTSRFAAGIPVGRETLVTTEIRTVLEVISAIRSLKTIQVPFMVGYETQKDKLDYSFSLGLGLNYAIGGSQFVVKENEFIDASGLSFSGLADIQLGYRVGDRFRIFGSVFGGRHFSNVASPIFSELLPDKVNSNLNHFGVRAGISYLL